MGIKTVIFAGLFAFCAIGALFNPLLGVLGYMAHYITGPDRQWWEKPIQGLGIRYSYWLVLATFAGMAINYRRLRFGKAAVSGQEKLLILFLAVIWLVTLLTPDTVGRYSVVDHPAVKFTKVVIFALILTHVVTDIRKLDYLLWVFVVGTLILGLQAYDTPRHSFNSGRLDSVGGPDFSDSNRLGGYLAGALFVIGVQFVRSKWIGRAVCFVAGGFAANAIVLTRSRGALLGVAGGGLIALVISRKEHRLKIAAGLLAACLGGLYLSDPQFLNRAATINRPEDQRDASAESRLEIWKGGMKMLMANPLGVGTGNFYQNIGKYAPEHPGRDAHNTFVRCAGELGFPGLIIFVALVLNAFRMLRNIIKRAKDLPDEYRHEVTWYGVGMATALGAFLTYGMTGTLIYTEYLWWMLAMPVCLWRTVENLETDQRLLLSPGGLQKGKKPGPRDNQPARGSKRNPLRSPRPGRDFAVRTFQGDDA